MRGVKWIKMAHTIVDSIVFEVDQEISVELSPFTDQYN